ncbi:MAG: squalene synthase HpnC [Candidatus Methylacidiphilales bacterium]
MTADVSYDRCSRLAREHYENFPVGWLVGKELRPHVHAIYAFARVADDLADEGYDLNSPDGQPLAQEEVRIEALTRYEEQLEAALAGRELDPGWAWIFRPLARTIRELDLPPILFRDLLSAFRQDVVKRRYRNFAEVLDYCRRSANPIGRLVLAVHGYREESLDELSDQICTGLQLANFWQDVSVDLKKDRIYLPEEDLDAFGLREEDLKIGQVGGSFRDLMRFEVDRTQTFFEAGRALPSRLRGKLALEIRLTWLGGTGILQKIRRLNYNTLAQRPKWSKWELPLLLLHALWKP